MYYLVIPKLTRHDLNIQIPNLLFIISTLLFACDLDKASTLKRIEVTSTSMSPTLNPDETYFTIQKDTVAYNDLVIFKPEKSNDLIALRVVGLPGDTIKMINKILWVNSTPFDSSLSVRHAYYIRTKKPLEDMIDHNDYERIADLNYLIHASQKEIKSIASDEEVISVRPADEYINSLNDLMIFKNYSWNLNNWGEVIIPKKGADLFKHQNFYHDLDIKKEYYFLLGDNRHNSIDSRFIGLISREKIEGVILQDL